MCPVVGRSLPQPEVGAVVMIIPDIIRSRTSFEIRFLPNTRRALDIARPIEGESCSVPSDHSVRGHDDQGVFPIGPELCARTQKSLSSVTSRGLACLRFKTISCCRRTRFSSTRLRRVRNTRRIDAKRTRMRGSMVRWYREWLVKSNGLCC